MKAYKKQSSAGLTNRNKLKRVKKCKMIKKRHGGPPIFFSDEKLLLLERPLNKQNDRVYGVSLQEIPRYVRAIPRYQNASGVMVFGAFFKQIKLLLKLIDRGVEINQQLYLNDILKSHVKPNADRMFGNRPYTFQQDSVSAHKAKTVQVWSEKNFPCSFQCRNGPPAVQI